MKIKFLDGSEKEFAYLSGAYLSSAYLSNAYLSSADLSGAYLSSADLSGADLSGANLRSADLRSADLRNAYLSSAYLSGANLRNANLRSADLRGADLRGADLRNAYLSSAYLSGANLRNANLRGAVTDDKTQWPAFQIPQTGQLTVYKKLADGVIAELLIGRKAKRTASLVGRKCRAEYVKVLSLTNREGLSVTEAFSAHNWTAVYQVGQIVSPDSYDPDPKVECTHGIHFFLTKEEALAY